MKEKFDYYFGTGFMQRVISIGFVVGIGAGVVLFAMSFFSSSGSDDARFNEAAESFNHWQQSRAAGKVAGYGDCENNRGYGATANVDNWDRDGYADGYQTAYTECSSKNATFERGLADGSLDCRSGSPYDLYRYDDVYYFDYKHGYERGYGSC